ncbi:MAG: hypothetical protein RMZ69_09060 [Nostoc sp. ChiQUE01a]|nr:hypothetical protein [Nostoc sp. ChiQUE01a]
MQNYSTGRVQDSPILVQQIGEEWALWNLVWSLSTGEKTILQELFK